MLGEIKIKNQTIKVTTRHILILNENMKITSFYEDRNIARFIYVDNEWVYALKNRATGYDNELQKPGGQV